MLLAELLRQLSGPSLNPSVHSCRRLSAFVGLRLQGVSPTVLPASGDRMPSAPQIRSEQAQNPGCGLAREASRPLEDRAKPRLELRHRAKQRIETCDWYWPSAPFRGSAATTVSRSCPRPCCRQLGVRSRLATYRGTRPYREQTASA